MATGSGQIRDAVSIGNVSEPPFVRLPDPSSLYAVRAGRFAALAQDSVLADYLLLLSSLVQAQHDIQQDLPIADLPADQRMQAATANGMPPLVKNEVIRDPLFKETLDRLLARLELAAKPAEAEAARIALVNATDDERTELAEAVADGSYPFERLAEAMYVAAALQVHLSRLASRLDAKALKPVDDGVCPACGSALVASMIVGWMGADGSRFCCCSLCGTLWNYVRIKCTSCGSTKGISYVSIEGSAGDIGVETCASCRSYIKHLYQQKNPLLDPVADDVASYGLDMLVREEGWRRTGMNPFLVLG